jgi:hypothetical protein
MTIWKFPIEVRESQIVHMPKGAKPLTVQMQNGNPCLWTLCDETQPPEPRCVAVYGTGHKLPTNPGNYIATFQMMEGMLVFHVFERPLN